MESRRDMYILSSDHQAFSAEAESALRSSSRVLQQSSGNVGLESISAVAKVEEDEEIDTHDAPSILEPRQSSRDTDTTRSSARRSRRSRLYPWERDRNFIRYELQSERYCAYRAKMRQARVQKWPDDVEDCLQYALRIIPCLGRKKDTRIDSNQELGGRNELIRDYILKWTGETRERKQVSSHLQVLKSYMKDNKEWMKFVTEVKDNGINSDSQSEYQPSESEYPDPSHASKNVGKYGYLHQSYSTALPPPAGILGSNAPPFVHQVDFEMFVNNESDERYHTYTRIQSEIGASSRALEEVAGWRTLYPPLTSYYHQGHLDSELILLETNFNLLRDYPPRGSTLGINPSILVKGGIKYCKWRSSTHLYERGVLVSSERKGIRLDDRLLDLNATNIESTNFTKVVLRTNCNWWASNVFGEILNRILAARAQGDEYATQQAEEWGRHFLEEMSMMQEIWATPESDGTSPRRIAILLWKFRQARDHEAATTTWRKLKPPCRNISINAPVDSPVDPLLQPPIPMNTSLQDIVMAQQAPQQAPAYTDYTQQTSFFVDDPESIITTQPSDEDSTLSTPTPDLRSLPSSTATSFTSSISGSLHPLHCMQEPPFNSQSSAHYSHDGGLDSQEAIYATQDSGYHSQNTAYNAPDLEYLPQEPSYPNPSQGFSQHDLQHHEAFYQHGEDYMRVEPPAILTRDHSSHSYNEHHDAQHVPDTDTTHDFARRLPYQSHTDRYSQDDHSAFAEAVPQDFTGGQIHISFADEVQQHHPYDQNHFTPPANMLSHHDSFDSQYEGPAQEVYQHDGQQISFGPNDELQQHHEQSLILHDTQPHEQSLILQDKQHHEQPYPIEPPFDHSSQTPPSLHHPCTTSPILHHPQPHASLQHHIDSARWQTHALWATMHLHSQDELEDCGIIDQTLHEQLQEEVTEIEGLDVTMAQEQEQGRILGEVSERLERELERELAKELERGAEME